MKREIFRHGKYEMCDVQGDTRAEGQNSLTMDDIILCFSEKDGYFLAQQSMGTWCEMDAIAMKFKYEMLLRRFQTKNKAAA
jgi:hypothetical protein